MKSRISSKFDELKKKGQKALITFITAGDPSLKVTEQLVHTLEGAGADIIELGVPFSDPLADGPTIQASHVRALKKDVSVDDVLKLIKKIRTKSNIPIALMISYNLIVKYGPEKFIQDSIKAGADGIISPDLPTDEASAFVNKSKGIDTIFLAAPTSTDERLKSIAESSTGFIYLISLLGITGARASLAQDVASNIRRIRKYSKMPVAVGFGVSKPAQVAEISRVADGVIVGSAIVDIVAKNSGKKTLLTKLAAYVARMKKATNA